jgi:hypothetical protein
METPYISREFRTKPLHTTQPLIEMSTRNISWGGKGGLHVPIVLKPGILNILETSVPVQACTGNAVPLSLPFNTM